MTIPRAALAGAAATLCGIGLARFAYVFALTLLYRAGPERLRERRWDWRTAFVISFAGVRGVARVDRYGGVEREIARLARKALRRILEGKETAVTITPENLADYAGVQK